MNELLIVRFLTFGAIQISKPSLLNSGTLYKNRKFVCIIVSELHLFIIITEYHMCGTFSLLQSWDEPPMMGEAGAASKGVCLQPEDVAESWRIFRPRQKLGLVADQRPVQ
jgi:hypothetical protein